MSQAIPEGATVRVKDPSGWLSHVSRRITGRDGVVKFFREGDRRYIVTFPAAGRRTEFTHQFRESDLEVVGAEGEATTEATGSAYG